MPIHQAANQVSSLFLGNKQVVAAYKGTELVFSSGLTQNIYVFDTSLISDSHKTITLSKSLRGDTSSNPITDWGDGTKDNLLTHTYVEDGVYTVRSKYGINGAKIIEGKEINSESYRKSLDYSLDINDYSHVVSIPNNSEQVYVRLCEPEDNLCIDYYTATANKDTYLMWERTDKFNTLENSRYGALRNESGHFHQLEEESLNFCVYGADCISGIYPIYFISEDTGVTLDGATLTPGVWCRRYTNYSLPGYDSRFSSLSWQYLSTIPPHCTGDTSTREALIEVQGINQRQNTLINMYYGCINLKTVNVEEEKNWNFKNVTSLESMFNKCTSLEIFDMSNWDLSNVTCVKDMFANSKISPAASEADDGNRITIDIADFGSEDFTYEQLGGGYSYYYKVSEIDDITEQHILGSGHIIYYIGDNHFATGMNSLDEEDFGPGSFIKSEEVQDGVTKSWYILKATEHSQSTLVIATITGYYDSARDIQFPPGIWIYVNTKTNSMHGAIWAAKQIVFEGDLLPKPYIIEFDPEKIDDYAESWGNTSGRYYKIAEVEDIPEENYLTGRGSMVMHYGDVEEYAEYDFTNLTSVNTHATSSNKTYYTPAIGDNSITYTSQAMLFMPYGMANWDSRFTPGIWVYVRYPYSDGDIDNAIYPTKVKLYGDDRKIYKFNYSESDDRGIYPYCQIDDQGEGFATEYYFITYSGLPEHKYLLGPATMKWEEKFEGVVTEKQANVELVRIVNFQGDCPIALYAARTPEYEETLFLIGYDDNSSVYNDNSITYDNVTLDCKGIWAICYTSEDGSYVIPKELRLREGTVDHSQMPEVNGSVTWTFDRSNSNDYDALDRGSYWSYYHIGRNTSVNYKHLRGSGSYTFVEKTSSSSTETVTTNDFAANTISCSRDEEGRELFTLYVPDSYGNSTHALYFTFDSRYPLSGTGCTLTPGGWAIVKTDGQYDAYFYISSITFNGDGPNRSPYDDTEL